MALKHLYLSLGERRAAEDFLQRVPQFTRDNLKIIREVRGRLQIRHAGREVDRLDEEGADLGFFQEVRAPTGQMVVVGLNWDDLLEPEEEVLYRLRRALNGEEDDGHKGRLQEFYDRMSSLLCGKREEPFVLEDFFLGKILEWAQPEDLKRQRQTDPRTGAVTDGLRPTTIAHGILFEDFCTEVARAKEAPSIEERQKL